jgi:hypothetical protein
MTDLVPLLRRLRTQYRVSSVAVIVVVVGCVLSFVVTPEVSPDLAPNGQSEPCVIWDQLTYTVRLGTVAAFAASLGCLFRGLWNRPAPRWLAIPGIAGLPIAFQYHLMREHTVCRPEIPTSELILCGALILMFLHHAIQPRRQRSAASGNPTESPAA